MKPVFSGPVSGGTRSPVAVAARDGVAAAALLFVMDVQERGLIGSGDNIVEMQDLDEENFAVCRSSDADAVFDTVIGNIEEIIMENDFQNLQQSFMEKYYLEFDDSEENKLCYTPIFNEYVDLLEKYLEQQLMERIPGFNMNDFTRSLKQHKDEVSGDIFDMLLTFTDFMAFKEMFIDYRAEREGRGIDLSNGLMVKSLSSATSPMVPSNTASGSL